MLKSAQETEKRISELLNAKESEITRLSVRIQEEEKHAEEASREMDQAVRDDDLKAYQAAKNKRLTAQDGAEMCRKKLHMLQNAPMISEDDYKTVSDQIREEFSGKEKEARKKLRKLSEEMAAISADLAEALEHANAVLSRWQDQIYRSKDRLHDQNGTPLMTTNANRIEYSSAIKWGRVGVECYAYKERK